MVYFEQHLILTDETYRRLDTLIEHLEQVVQGDGTYRQFHTIIEELNQAVVHHRFEHVTFSPEGIRQAHGVIDRIGNYLLGTGLYLLFTAIIFFLAVVVFSLSICYVWRPGRRREERAGRRFGEKKEN